MTKICIEKGGIRIFVTILMKKGNGWASLSAIHLIIRVEHWVRYFVKIGTPFV